MSEKIVVLSDKDKVRNMINLYHGSAENHTNMIKELIGNSLDIFKKNFPDRDDNKIQIILHNSNKIEFTDNATGIPVEGIASDDSPNYEAIFEKDCAGSNYGKHTDTVGQHGVFLYTLTMTSEDIEYFIGRPNNKIYNIKYHKGDKVSDLKIVDNCQNTYTKIIFSLDREVWNNPVFTFEEICDIAQGQSSLMDVEISVIDKKHDLKKIFSYENGIEDFFNESILDKKTTTENIRITKEFTDVFKKKGTNIDLTDNIKIDMIFNYSNDDEECFQKEFLNTADLIQHGTIQEGIIYGLKSSIDKWLEKNNKYNKNEKHIGNEDVLTGLNYICNFKSLYVEYENQTKQKTSLRRCKNIMKNVIEEYMEVFFIENPLMSDRICAQVLINSRAKEKADKARKTIRKKLSQKVDGLGGRVDGLIDCKYHNEESELFISEGKSALGSVILARNPNTQAGYAIRGKVLSCLKASYQKIFSNDVVVDLIRTLGCGVEVKSKYNKELNSFNIDNLRYGRIVISTDSDWDGMSIQVLLLTMFHKLMPELIKQGKIYISQTPRYVIKNKNDKYYAFTDDEKENIISKLEGKTSINYLKGLGELDSIDMYNTALDPNNRQMIRVTIGNVEEMVKKFEIWMGTDVAKRKEFIQNHLHEYINDEE